VQLCAGAKPKREGDRILSDGTPTLPEAGIIEDHGDLSAHTCGPILLAAIVIAGTIYFCFAYSDRVEKMLGHGGTDIMVRLSAFILFCIGVQIIWSGASDLIGTVISPTSLQK
jgi:hypothetical protein